LVLVQTMRYHLGREYRDGATVEIWTNGLWTLSAYGRTEKMPESVVENPYLIESELLGPLSTLEPGESASLAYDWYAATIGLNPDGITRIIECSSVGCVVHPFSFSSSGEMTGHFGCFCEGYAAIEFVGEDGHLIESPRFVGRASMLAPLQLSGSLSPPKAAARVTLAIYKTLAGAHEPNVIGRLGELDTALLRSN
jgi:hypothetical protein